MGGIIPVFISGGGCRFHFAGLLFQRSNEMFRYEQPYPVKARSIILTKYLYLRATHTSLKEWYSVF